MKFSKRNLNILFTVHIVKFIRASIPTVDQKNCKRRLWLPKLNNFTDEF